MGRLTERAEIDKCPGIWVKEGLANEGNKTWFNGYDEGYSAINKCADYEDLEEQGKLLKLPCAVGDKIYLPNEYVGKVIDFEIIEICIFKEGIMFIDDSGDEYFINDFGKTVFLTKEEAESALKEYG